MSVSHFVRCSAAAVAVILLSDASAMAWGGGGWGGGSWDGGSWDTGSTEEASTGSETTSGSEGPIPCELQSSFRVFDMDIAGLVYESGSDERAAAFNDEILPSAVELVEVALKEGVEFLAAGITRLDEDQLFIMNPTDRPVRVYFINEGAGYRNTLGYSTTIAGSVEAGDRVIIFPDVSDGSFGGTAYLKAGDFVELGDFGGGTQFEFFIVRDAVNGGRDIFTYRDDLNPDGIQHLAAWLLGDRYVLLGFEDLMNGGDLDYNDVVAVVDLNDDLGQDLELPK